MYIQDFETILYFKFIVQCESYTYNYSSRRFDNLVQIAIQIL